MISLFHFSRSDAKHDDDQPKVDKLSLKRKGIGSEARAERMANANTDLQLLSGPERERQLLKQKKRGRKGHEEDVCIYFLFFGCPENIVTISFLVCVLKFIDWEQNEK